jgi:hypothetical protein
VNARDNTPLRTLIADRLAAGEDTAAGIASAIGKGDTPSIVVKELNAMRTDGQVECEQRGKKKELVYWLAVPLDVAAASAAPESAAGRTPANHQRGPCSRQACAMARAPRRSTASCRSMAPSQ